MEKAILKHLKGDYIMICKDLKELEAKLKQINELQTILRKEEFEVSRMMRYLQEKINKR